MASDANKILEWTNRFKRFQRSQSSVTKFCREENISVPAFYYWRDRVPQDLAVSRDSSASGTSGSGIKRPSSESTSDGPLSTGCNAGSVVRFTIQVGTVGIQCEATSLQAIDLLLDWATRNQGAQFKELILGNGSDSRC